MGKHIKYNSFSIENILADKQKNDYYKLDIILLYNLMSINNKTVWGDAENLAEEIKYDHKRFKQFAGKKFPKHMETFFTSSYKSAILLHKKDINMLI